MLSKQVQEPTMTEEQAETVETKEADESTEVAGGNYTTFEELD